MLCGAKRSSCCVYSWVSNHGMPDWIKRNEDLNYLQEGRDRARAWTTLLAYNVTHIVMDDAEVRKRWDVTFLNTFSHRSAANGRSSIHRVVPLKYISLPQVRL